MLIRDIEGSRSEVSSTGLEARVLSTFLNELDGISSGHTTNTTNTYNHSKVVLIAACADLNLLDEALLRPGRLQFHIHLHYPTKDDIFEIITIRTKLLPLHKDLNLKLVTEELFQYLEKPKCSDVDILIQYVIQNVIRDSISINDTNELNNANNTNHIITQLYFDEALKIMFENLENATSNADDIKSESISDPNFISIPTDPFGWTGSFSSGIT